MKKFIALALVLVASQAQAATALWTGNSRHVTTVTYQLGISCEYQLYGNRFWRTFSGGSCPMSVEVY